MNFHKSKFHKIKLLVFTAFALGNMSFIPVSSALEDTIVAVVDNELITFKDMRDYIKNTYIALVAQGLPDKEIKLIMQDLEKNGLAKLIEDKILLARANKLDLQIREKAIDDKIAEIKTRYKSEQEFMQGLIDNGASLTDLRNKIIEQLKIKAVIDVEVKSRIYVNPQEITNYYENNIKSFYKKEQVDLESVFINYKNNKEAAMAKAREALEKIRSGKKFKEVGQQYSDTPSVGMVERGQLLPTIEKQVFHMKKNEVSDLIETDNGVFIFKLIERFPAQMASLDEVRDMIHNLLYKKKFQDRFNSWLDDLKKNTYVEIKE